MSKLTTKQKKKITGDEYMSEIIDSYPLVVDYLIDEYEFYCMNCIMAEFETLKEGCDLHGIRGEDYAELLDAINELIV